MIDLHKVVDTEKKIQKLRHASEANRLFSVYADHMDRSFVQGKWVWLLAALSLTALGCADKESNDGTFATGTAPVPSTTTPAGSEDTGDQEADSDESTGEDEDDSDTAPEGTTTGEPMDTDVDVGGLDAFRFTELVVRDPHFYSAPPVIGCIDITDTTPLGADASVNGVFRAAINSDDPEMPDGMLDLNLILLFRPLDQTEGAQGNMDFANGACPTADAGSSCAQTPGTPMFAAAYTNMSAGSTCLAPEPGNLGGYSPQPMSTSGPCLHAGPTQIQIATAVFSLDLSMVEVAAQYDGEPTNGLISGSVKGFISRSVAESTPLPAELAGVIGASNVAGLLAGHPTNCKTDTNDMDGDGWWMHADFKAERVEWTD